MYDDLWISMSDIMVYVVDKNKTIQQLYQLKLLDYDNVRIIHTTQSDFRAVMITRLLADRILTGNKDDLTTRVATFMGSHWALKYLYQHWKKTCKRFMFFSKYFLESSHTKIYLHIILYPFLCTH